MKMVSSVAIVKGDYPYNMMEEALRLAGVPHLINPNSRVFIKPNLVGIPKNSPYFKVKGTYARWIGPVGFITRRDVLEALLKTLKGWDVKDITIGEASGGCQTTVAYKALAFSELAEEYGVDLIDLNYAESVKVPVPDKLILDYVWLPKILRESDFLIDLTTFKVHGRTTVSFCLKNWGVGILPGKYYGFDKSGSHIKGLDSPLPIHKKGGKMVMGQEVAVIKVIVDVCKTIPPHLGIIDGITAVQYAKLDHKIFGKMKAKRLNLMIASSDIVAVDAVASRIARIAPEKVLHIQLAAEKGLGVLDSSRIKVKGAAIEDVQIRCNPLLSQKELMF